jgi:hypothetical protein
VAALLLLLLSLLLQALLCNHTKGASDCDSLSFCRSMNDECVPKLYAQDNFGATVQEYLVSVRAPPAVSLSLLPLVTRQWWGY